MTPRWRRRHNEKCQAGARAPGSCRSETQGKLGRKISQYSLLEVFFFSFRILSGFTGSPDSILRVLVITHLTTSQTGPLHPATVGFRPTDLSAGRPITDGGVQLSWGRWPGSAGESGGLSRRSRAGGRGGPARTVTDELERPGRRLRRRRARVPGPRLSTSSQRHVVV
jgi:hypothetical protein